MGVTLGTAIGVLPGVGPALTVAMLLPLTVKLDPTGALIMFAGIYYGAMYGGSTTTILLNTPGESASIATALEGNKMARRGRAGPALATAAIGSFVAGTIATLLLTLLAPIVVEIALKFGPAEYFALMVFAFVTVAAVLGSSTVRGLTMLFLGLLLGLVGIDDQTGQMRFAFGVPELLDGVDVVVLAVGLFAVGEALYMASYQSRQEERVEQVRGSLLMSKDDWRRSWPAWLRATFIGFPFGTIPAGGAEIPTFLSYALEKKLSKHPEEFGHGAIEGVAGPEAANNAASAGVLVPLLTLGIPTSATAAILLAAFQNYGLQPGPLLFQTQATLVWGLIASMYIGNILLLVLNLPLIGLWVKVLSIPKPLLYGGILVFATLGAYSLHQSVVDLVTLYVFGLLGFVMRRWGFPVAPVVIGLILGPLAESQFRKALAISQGDPSVFFTHPISASLLALTAALIIVPWIVRAAAPQAPTESVSDLEPPRGGNEGAAPRAAFSFWRALGAIAVAVAGALVCVYLKTPLPWLIGPLVAVAAVSMSHGKIAAPPLALEGGQWAIGVALGLYFSPDVVREIARLSPWIALAVVFSIVLGWLGAWLLAKAVRADAPTAFFAMAIGGAPEMAAQAHRNGGQVDKVAASHALRIMLVVLIVPFAFNAMNVHGLDPYAPLAKTFSWTGFIVLVAITAAAAAVMERFKSPNSWMIGPLLAAALVTATGHSFSTFPAGVVNAGQLLIGISLGSRFTPEFFGAAPRFLSAVAAISLLYMVLAAGFAGLLARGSGLPWPTATIATTPGGIGEMALTAQALQLGVPIVTAFHTIRLLALLLTVGAMYRYWRKWMVRRAS